MRWFRFYDEALDDPKVQRLSHESFHIWVNLLCVASRNGGHIPSDLTDLAFSMRMQPARLESQIRILVDAELLDSGDSLRPHNWDKRQYQSDGSNARVKRYREKRKANGLPVLSDYSKYKPALIARDGECCVYCLATESLVVDHMVPIEMGGNDDLDNLALACRACNSGKSGRTPEMARLHFRVSTAEQCHARYRDKSHGATVTLTPPEAETEAEAEQSQKQSAAPPKLAGCHERYGEVCQTVMNILGPNAVRLNRVDAWLKDGADPDADIYPTLKRMQPSWRGSNLTYFDGAIADAIASRTKPLPEGQAKSQFFNPVEAAKRLTA